MENSNDVRDITQSVRELHAALLELLGKLAPDLLNEIMEEELQGMLAA